MLNDLKEIKICKTYQGKTFNEINFSNSDFLNSCNLLESDYEVFPGWGNLENNDYQNLPENLKKYISYIENYLELHIKIISLGPERNETILR